MNGPDLGKDIHMKIVEAAGIEPYVIGGMTSAYTLGIKNNSC